MSWHGIDGHDDVVEQFRRALVHGRLASSFLFAGPAGVGKRTFALKLAQARALLQLAREFNTTFIVNDDAQLTWGVCQRLAFRLGLSFIRREDQCSDFERVGTEILRMGAGHTYRKEDRRVNSFVTG